MPDGSQKIWAEQYPVNAYCVARTAPASIPVQSQLGLHNFLLIVHQNTPSWATGVQNPYLPPPPHSWKEDKSERKLEENPMQTI